MGYLNNSSRILDAILTKKGRELLSTGGNFTVTKFALGDDEIDYSLWDASHTQGTDYYGAVIDNLPALEPFNDPSEIMKYKLVSRSEGVQAMAKLQDEANNTHALALGDVTTDGQTTTGGLTFVDVANENNWFAVLDSTGTDTTYKLGSMTAFGISHLANGNYTNDYGGGPLSIFGDTGYADETYTVTILDTSVAVLAPESTTALDGDPAYPIVQSAAERAQSLWLPFVQSPQHLSQTLSRCSRKTAAGVLTGAGAGENGPNGLGTDFACYCKRLTSGNSPAKTSIIITGESSGAVFEYEVVVRYSSS